MNPNLGALPLSHDLLLKSKLGMWAFELDEGKAPRMYVDEAMLSLIGLTEQISPEDTYHAWYDHVDPAYYGLVEEAVAKMSAGQHAEVKYPWHHPDGRVFTVRCGGVRNPAYTAGVRIEGCHQDITQIQSFTMEFKEQRQRLETDYQTIQGLSNEYDILHLLNLETDEFTPFYIENVNMFDTEFLLASFEGFYNAMKASITSMIHPDHLERMLKYSDKEHIRRALRHKSRVVERVLVKNITGEYIWCDFVLIKFDDIDCEPTRIAVGYINVDEDMKAMIAERNRIEDIERKVEEERRAKESEEERYNFLINVAHEIRTPLTLILGPLGRFLTTEQLSEKGLKTISRVRQQANRINILLDTVLTSNKMEEGSGKICPEPVKFNEWLQRNADDFIEEAANREMTLECSFDTSLDIVDMDEHLCTIALSNLIINAMKFNEPGYPILISSSLSEDGGMARISVKDHGAGIGDVDVNKLFERYYRATEDKTGFGIGLFYSRNIISAHNGRIGAYNNEDGSGATFWFELPIN